MASVRAIYEDGVLRLLEPIALPDGSEVEVEIHAASGTTGEATGALARFIGAGRSGRSDISERIEELLRAGFGR